MNFRKYTIFRGRPWKAILGRYREVEGECFAPLVHQINAKMLIVHHRLHFWRFSDVFCSIRDFLYFSIILPVLRTRILTARDEILDSGMYNGAVLNFSVMVIILKVSKNRFPCWMEDSICNEFPKVYYF